MNTPMIAKMAMQPFAHSAANLFLSNARSGESESKAPSTPGAVRQVVPDELADDRPPGRAAVRQLRGKSATRTSAAASPSTGPSRPRAPPVRSSRMTMPMIAIMAKQPFDTFAADITLSNARSGESEYEAHSTPGAVREGSGESECKAQSTPRAARQVDHDEHALGGLVIQRELPQVWRELPTPDAVAAQQLQPPRHGLATRIELGLQDSLSPNGHGID